MRSLGCLHDEGRLYGGADMEICNLPGTAACSSLMASSRHTGSLGSRSVNQHRCCSMRAWSWSVTPSDAPFGKAHEPAHSLSKPWEAEEQMLQRIPNLLESAFKMCL
ncbi:hypothetical protein WJX74_005060 [Apatococcus lobatus]|uniref:Uncharacterized protein n=1 Tax=Apatococcus lobatus TaxID=904363 RepID=A0AAW1RYR1_9CHLO